MTDLCSVCGKPFTDAEWDDRHTDPEDGMSDCHARCCPDCNRKPAPKRRTPSKPKHDSASGTKQAQNGPKVGQLA